MPISELNVLTGRIYVVYILTVPVETPDPGVTSVGSRERCRFLACFMTWDEKQQVSTRVRSKNIKGLSEYNMWFHIGLLISLILSGCVLYSATYKENKFDMTDWEVVQQHNRTTAALNRPLFQFSLSHPIKWKFYFINNNEEWINILSYSWLLCELKVKAQGLNCGNLSGPS